MTFNYDMTFLSYFIQAGLVVKAVMLLLAVASVFSWTYILQQFFYLRSVVHSAKGFEKAFWSGTEPAKLYAAADREENGIAGMEAIFHAGYKEYLLISKEPNTNTEQVIENTQRAMRVQQMREQNKLEQNLAFLAIVGSTSPYVGLFGTVWGIMQAFRALANVQQATISMVAPGIAEALIATALGLFAAIPAVIAYNRFVTGIGRLQNRFDAFQEEFTNTLIRQLRNN